VSSCQISCRRCDDDHSANRGGPAQYWGASVRGLTTCWLGKSSRWLPPYTANYGCDCLREVDLGTDSGGNPKGPCHHDARDNQSSASCLARRGQVGWHILGPARRPTRSSGWRSPERAGGWSKAASVEPLDMRRLSRPGLSAGAFPCRHTRRGPSANTTDADLSLLVHAYAITPRTTSESCAMRPYERGTPAGRIRRLLASSHPRILLQVSFAAVQGDA
jgi:hypothetical protein